MTASLFGLGDTPALSDEEFPTSTNYVAVGDGVTVCTAELKALFDYCIPAKKTAFIMGGHYIVDGPITSDTYADGELNIYCVGEVTIEVAVGSDAFNSLIKCYTTAQNSSVIAGGKLNLILNNICANGIYLRHAATAYGGSVNWGPVYVENAKNNFNINEENQGLLVYGRYTSVLMEHAEVNGVTRIRDTTMSDPGPTPVLLSNDGVCKGISISEIAGQVTLISPKVSNVLAGPDHYKDADGIAVFGLATGGVYEERLGVLHISNPVIKDCEGRSIKTQISNSTIEAPKIFRSAVIPFATADIDHQAGGTHVINNPGFEWKCAVPSTFYALSMQARCTNAPNKFQVTGGYIHSQTAVSYAVFLTVGASALQVDVSIDGMQCVPLSGLATAMFSRGLLEFNAGQVETASGNVHIALRNNKLYQTAAGLLALTGATVANQSKLSFELVGNVNTGANHASNFAYARLGGVVISQVRDFVIRDNSNFASYLGTWVFDARTLSVGTRFTYDRASSTVTNGPVIAAGSYVDVECLGALTGTTRIVRMTVENPATVFTSHYTQTGAWGTL